MFKLLMSMIFVMAPFHVVSSLLKTSVFSSIGNLSDTVDLETAKFKKSLFIAYDCASCHQLLRQLQKKCSAVDVTTFAVGNKKNLNSKLRILKKLKSKVYTGSTTQAYADIGIDLMPYYISSKGRKHESNILSVMLQDSVCRLKAKKERKD